ncbi:MAG TPA: hypothetical protein VHO70_11470 [Chitinispirillaceae bacterium]|nr:hypothetical protein [Chitinispirillaceae bacterium]
MELSEQQMLGLFPERSFDQLLALKNITGHLCIKVSSRMGRGWNVTCNRITGKRTLTIPKSLSTAPETVKMALISWALLPLGNKGKKSSDVQKNRKQIENYIYQHLCEHGLIKPPVSRINRETLNEKTAGTKFDLQLIFEKINVHYFENKLRAYLRWGIPGSTTSYQTVRRSKDGSCWNLITIADIYNHPAVPQFAIESVMFHEMLHIAIPPYRKNGKNVIHGKEFKAAEKLFPFFEQWQEWENKELKLLLKDLRRRNR